MNLTSNSFDWIEKWSQYSPNKIAVAELESGAHLTYAQLNQYANNWASEFQNNYNLTNGDRIAILAENCNEYVLLFAVAQKLGIVLIPLNYRLSQGEINFLITDAQPKLILVEEKFQPLLAQVPKQYQSLTLSEFRSITQQISQTNTSTFKRATIQENNPIFILYTSGTTGNPKGAIYTHKMLFWNSINTELRLDITSADVTISVMPPFHTGGWNVLLTPFLHHGATTILSKKFEATTLLESLDSLNITVFMGVPTMLKMLADAPNFNQVKLEKLRYFIVGGEAMPVPLIETWAQKNVLIRQGYGLTEVGPNITSLNHTDAIRKKGSIGTPNFYVQTKIVNEQGNEIKPNETGELLLGGPNVTPGYLNNPEATQKAIVNGWFHTGDIVKIDEEGFLYVVDRIKNMYISGGENVYPAQVEKVLIQHPEIQEIAIIGVPDSKWGETGLAAIVSTNKNLSVAQLQEFCTNKLAKFKQPKHILHLNELPKNATGKIDKNLIKQLFNNQ